MSPRGDDTDDPYRPFRPRFSLVTAWVTGIVVVGGCVLLAIVARGPLAHPATRFSILAFAAGAALLLWRFGGARAVPDRDGITVRNVIYTRRLAWPQVLGVQFGTGDPWVRLDLADGRTQAVMGIQRSDGARGQAEADRLAALVQAHGEAVEHPPDGPGR